MTTPDPNAVPQPPTPPAEPPATPPAQPPAPLAPEPPAPPKQEPAKPDDTLAQIRDALGALPEKILDGIREGMGLNNPPPAATPPAGTAPGAPAATSPGTPPATPPGAPAAPVPGTDPGKRTFAQRWFGV